MDLTVDDFRLVEDPNEFGPEIATWINAAITEMSDEMANDDEDLAHLRR